MQIADVRSEQRHIPQLRRPPGAQGLSPLELRCGGEAEAYTLRRVHRHAGQARGLGVVGAEPDRNRHGRRPVAGGVRGGERIYGGEDVQHLGVRPDLRVADLLRRPEQGRGVVQGRDYDLRHAGAAGGERGGEPGLAGRIGRRQGGSGEARVPAGQFER